MRPCPDRSWPCWERCCFRIMNEALDFLAAVEHLQAAVAVLASFLVDPLRADWQVRRVGQKPDCKIDRHHQPCHCQISWSGEEHPILLKGEYNETRRKILRGAKRKGRFGDCILVLRVGVDGGCRFHSRCLACVGCCCSCWQFMGRK